MRLKNLKKVLRNVERWIEQWVRQTLDEMEDRAKQLTPVKEWELINWYTKTYDPGSKSWVLWNNVEHAAYVEYGTSTARLYHKWPPSDDSTVFRTTWEYQWLRWARMMTQTADEFKPKFTRQITSKINNEILTSR